MCTHIKLACFNTTFLSGFFAEQNIFHLKREWESFKGICLFVFSSFLCIFVGVYVYILTFASN